MPARTPTAPSSLSPPPLLRKSSSTWLITEHESDHLRSWLDGKHVVFGEVLEGYDIVEKVESVPTRAGNKPTKDVKIVKSGELELEADASAEEDDSKGSHKEL